MQTPTWVRSTRYLIRQGKFPTKRRRAKWEADRLFHKVLASLKPGDIAIDCGANVGKFTEKMARTGATVYAFEPDPYCVVLLQEKFRDWPNVCVFDKAAGVADDEVKLYRAVGFDENPARHSTSSSVFATKTNCDVDSAISVAQIDLVKFIGELPSKVRLLKMDIEGAEVSILEQLFDTGEIERVERVFAETHDRKIPELGERLNSLRRRLSADMRTKVNLDWR